MPTTFHKAACIIATPPKTAAMAPGPGDPLATNSWNFRVSLDKKQVQHIALLARLKLDDSEYAESVEKLSKIVEFVAQLSQAETGDIVPMAHPLDMSSHLRPDVVSETVERERYQENAADVSSGFYLVPKVLGPVNTMRVIPVESQKRPIKTRGE